MEINKLFQSIKGEVELAKAVVDHLELFDEPTESNLHWLNVWADILEKAGDTPGRDQIRIHIHKMGKTQPEQVRWYE